MRIYPLDPALFTQYLWEGCTIQQAFGFPLRTHEVKKNAKKIVNHVVGYCKAEKLFVRRKKNEVAVMFEKGGRRWWNHLRKEEFQFLCKE